MRRRRTEKQRQQGGWGGLQSVWCKRERGRVEERELVRWGWRCPGTLVNLRSCLCRLTGEFCLCWNILWFPNVLLDSCTWGWLESCRKVRWSAWPKPFWSLVRWKQFAWSQGRKWGEIHGYRRPLGGGITVLCCLLLLDAAGVTHTDLPGQIITSLLIFLLFNPHGLAWVCSFQLLLLLKQQIQGTSAHILLQR